MSEKLVPAIDVCGPRRGLQTARSGASGTQGQGRQEKGGLSRAAAGLPLGEQCVWIQHAVWEHACVDVWA